MSVIRNASRTHFTITPNATLRDSTLSLKAKGLLALMLSFPDDWDYHMKHLQDLSTDGREAHRSAMKELIENGYVSRKPQRLSDGTVKGWVYLVSDTPGDRKTGFPSDGKPPPTKTDTYEEPEDQDQKRTSPEATRSSPSSSAKERPDSEQVGKLVEVWEAHRGGLPSVKSISNARRRKLASMVKQLGFDQALDIMKKATIVVSKDDFWLSRHYGLDNLLAGEKYVQKAEAYDSSMGGDALDASVGDRVVFVVHQGTMKSERTGVVREIDGKQFHVEADIGGVFRMSHHHIIKVLS